MSFAYGNFMLLIMVGCQILPTTLRIFTHMDHVHTAPIHVIVLAIVHLGDNIPIFHMSKWTPIFSIQGLNQIPISTPQTRATTLISRGKLMLQEIMLPKLMNCTILNIGSLTINFLLLHPAIILHKIHPWKTPSKHSYCLIAKPCMRLKMPP